jgi:hypothetical protein
MPKQAGRLRLEAQPFVNRSIPEVEYVSAGQKEVLQFSKIGIFHSFGEKVSSLASVVLQQIC